jgi:hypothetical protein
MCEITFRYSPNPICSVLICSLQCEASLSIIHVYYWIAAVHLPVSLRSMKDVRCISKTKEFSPGDVQYYKRSEDFKMRHEQCLSHLRAVLQRCAVSSARLLRDKRIFHSNSDADGPEFGFHMCNSWHVLASDTCHRLCFWT